MKARVKFYGAIKHIVPDRQAEFEVAEGTTVRELLKVMAANYGEEFAREVLTKGDKLSSHVRLAVEGETVEDPQLDRPLFGDEEAPAEVTVMVIPSLMGG